MFSHRMHVLVFYFITWCIFFRVVHAHLGTAIVDNLNLFQAIIVGKPDDEETTKMLKVIHSKFTPHQISIYLDPADTDNVLLQRLDVLKSMISCDMPTAYVCENFTCSLPVNSSEDFEKLLM